MKGSEGGLNDIAARCPRREGSKESDGRGWWLQRRQMKLMSSVQTQRELSGGAPVPVAWAALRLGLRQLCMHILGILESHGMEKVMLVYDFE